MDFFPWLSMVVVGALSASCVQQQVVQSMEAHKVQEGKVHADEVMAQSPFKKVELDWKTAKALMVRRNPKYRAASLGFVEASKDESVIKDFGEHVGSGLGKTIKTVADPDELVSSLKSPVTSIPKQFESLSSLKDISYEMASSAWEKKERAVVCRKEMRKEEVVLLVLFKRSALLERHLHWISKVRESELDEGTQKELLKFEKKLLEDRKVWLGEVRDFFNAEYFDVTLANGGKSMAGYRKLSQPDFSDWKRWGALNRVEALAKVLKKQHETRKPMIPGTVMVKEKLAGMFHVGAATHEGEIATKEVRASIRNLIRNWREMKLAQHKIAVMESTVESVVGVNEELVAKRLELYQVEGKELGHAREIWMVDERCWSGS